MAYTVDESLKQKKEGFYIGNRLILPFRCQLIKIIVESKVLTEMVGSNDIKIQQDPQNTSIYFRHIGSLKSSIGEFEVIKLIVCEWDNDLCEINRHIKLICEIKDKHRVLVHEPDSDMLFIE